MVKLFETLLLSLIETLSPKHLSCRNSELEGFPAVQCPFVERSSRNTADRHLSFDLRWVGRKVGSFGVRGLNIEVRILCSVSPYSPYISLKPYTDYSTWGLWTTARKHKVLEAPTCRYLQLEGSCSFTS